VKASAQKVTKPAERRVAVSAQQRALIAATQQDVAVAQERLNLVLSTVLAGASVKAGQVQRLERTDKQWWLVYVVPNGGPPDGGKEP